MDIIFEVKAGERIGMDIQNQKYFCQVNVFDTPRDLEKQVEMVSKRATDPAIWDFRSSYDKNMLKFLKI